MPCYCSSCFPSSSRELTQKTVKTHLKADEVSLLNCSYEDNDKRNHLRACIEKNRNFLNTGNLQGLSAGEIQFHSTHFDNHNKP